MELVSCEWWVTDIQLAFFVTLVLSTHLQFPVCSVFGQERVASAA